jgi:hypothetical protein
LNRVNILSRIPHVVRLIFWLVSSSCHVRIQVAYWQPRIQATFVLSWLDDDDDDGDGVDDEASSAKRVDTRTSTRQQNAH